MLERQFLHTFRHMRVFSLSGPSISITAPLDPCQLTSSTFTQRSELCAQSYYRFAPSCELQPFFQ
jgi:hypothetical protein